MKGFKHPATIIAAVALFVALGGGAALASGLVSGSQIKNHSIPAKKLTASAIKSLRGQSGPAGPQGAAGTQGIQGTQGIKGSQGSQGIQGIQGQQGDPATADGPAVEFGNMQGSIADACAVGAPSGVSTTTNCNPGAGATVSSPLPADAAVTDLSVTVGSPVAADTFEAVSEAFGGTPLLGCTILAGNTSCTEAGPSSTVSAGTPLIFIDWDPTQTTTSFSYRLVTPGVTPAAAPKALPKSTPKWGFSR